MGEGGSTLTARSSRVKVQGVHLRFEAEDSRVKVECSMFEAPSSRVMFKVHSKFKVESSRAEVGGLRFETSSSWAKVQDSFTIQGRIVRDQG